MIGIFDSGIGGLTVVRAIRKRIPAADILYFGDVARMPYGNKSAATVIGYSREIVSYLLGRGADTIVIACNTASAVAERALCEEFSVPIVDVIAPAVETAVGTGAGKIAVLGTRATIGSGAYQKAIRRLSPKAKAYPLACPMFVPLVEEGYAGTRGGKMIVEQTLRPLAAKGIKTVILGCTHYPLLAKQIKAVLPAAALIDSSSVAEAVAKLAGKRGRGRTEIVATDITPHFQKFAASIIGKKIAIKKISLEKLSKHKK